ncbi:MAG TPA: carboxypeptidase-like regulatory domain-containing protein [Pyrinomonadaceae bacterium]|nr:carboxypeptidase-like regulatory domain-containing protein [Pyrinomonadaceae bacterium]
MPTPAECLRVVLALCLCCAAAAHARARGEGEAAGGPAAASQDEGMIITVEGVTLAGPFNLPQRRGGRLFLPVVSVGRALGDRVRVLAEARAVEVLRQTGVAADFDAGLGRVRENGAPVLVTPDAGDIVFPPQPEALMLPTEVVSALLDASVQIDTAARVVRVTRARAEVAPVKSARRGPFELYDAEYNYNLDRYETGSSQSLTLRSTGRFRDGRFSLLGNFGASRGRLFDSLRSGALTFERPGGQRLVAGDFGTGNDLAFLSSTIRGGWAQMPLGPARLTVFGGRMMGGPLAESPVEAAPEVAPRPADLARPEDFSRAAYDTGIFGSYLTFGPGAGDPLRANAPAFSAGAVSFSGPWRGGKMLTGGVRSSTERYSFQADFGAGSFRAARPGGLKAEGTGVAADVSGSFNVREDLTLHGRYAYAGRDFLTPQTGAALPLNQQSLGLTWRPRAWLTATLTGSATSRPDAPGRAARFLTSTVSLTPRRYLSSLLLTHTQTGAGQLGSGSYTLLSATKEFSRWRLFANASRIRALGPAYATAQFGAALRVRESDSLQLSQTFGGRGALSGTADWWTQSFLTDRVRLGAGVGYSRADGSPLRAYERVSAGVRLPFGQEAQISLGLLQSGTQLSVSLRGPLYRRREARAEAGGPVEELNRRGSVSGRVYQDLNLDGRYDPGADAPQPNVRVRVDGNLYATTDGEGLYRIAEARAGEHAVALDLLSVRADLTILGERSRAVTLQPGFDAVVDFRVVRTGRLTGTVWLDLDGDGRLGPHEQALAGVRVVTDGGRDTLTDELGQYVIGDLPPGLHTVLIDAKTLPDATVARALAAAQPGGVAQVSVAAGAETGNVNFAVSPKPAEVKRF